MLVEVIYVRDARSITQEAPPTVISPDNLVVGSFIREQRSIFATGVITGEGGGGAAAFIDLTDVPTSYAGAANRFVSVKGDESGLQFVSTIIPSFLALPDTPDSYSGQANKQVTVNGGETALQFTTPPTIPTTLLALTDVPDSYSGQANKQVAVKSDESGVEFVAPTATPTFLALPDTPDSYSGQADKLVRVNGAASALEFATPPTILDTFLELTDTPDSFVGQGDKVLRVKADESGVEFRAPIDTFTELTDTPDDYTGFGGYNVSVKPDASGLEFQPSPPAFAGSYLISGGGVAWTGTGFNYTVSPATYVIGGVQYSSPQTNITLTAADPTNDRIDVIAVNASGAAVLITGTPGGPPVEPAIDPSTQLRLTIIYVAAATTAPPITEEDIYLENAEYTMSTNSSGTINLASTNNPHAGTKDVEGTNTANGNLFSGVKPSGTIALSNYLQLVFYIRSKAAWPSQKSISIFWLNGTTVVGSAVALKTGTFGFNSSQVTSYQQIVIPVSSFNAGSTPVNTLRFSVAGGGANIGWYIDDIILQSGTAPPPPGGGDFSTNTNASVANEIVMFADTSGKLGKRSTGSGFARLVSGVMTPVGIIRNFIFGRGKTSGLAAGKISGYWTCPFAGVISAWNLAVDVGTITVKIWKIATGTAHPTNANSINTSGISLSTGTAIRSTTLTDFITTAVAAGDIFACEITAVGGGVTEFGGSLEITQT